MWKTCRFICVSRRILRILYHTHFNFVRRLFKGFTYTLVSIHGKRQFSMKINCQPLRMSEIYILTSQDKLPDFFDNFWSRFIFRVVRSWNDKFHFLSEKYIGVLIYIFLKDFKFTYFHVNSPCTKIEAKIFIKTDNIFLKIQNCMDH